MNRIIPFVIICALLNISAYADGTHPQGIKLDGSVGTAGKLSLTGPDYAIKPEYGKQSGANLFHSFQQFNVHSGESATFSGPDSVKNIISRVTGGSASWIDGRLSSTIPGADLYFLNPAGVMFGSNATLDLSGSFHVSTADYLRMGDNERFYSKPIENEILSVAAPSAFGFLSDKPAKISIEGRGYISPEQWDGLLYKGLTIRGGSSLSLIGGDIEIRNGSHTTINQEIQQLGSIAIPEKGRINLASAASSGEVSFKETGIDISSEKLGNITLSEQAAIHVGGGKIYIRGGVLIADKAYINAGQIDLPDGKIIGGTEGKIDIDVNTLSFSYGSGIFMDTYDTGNAGTLNIRAAESVRFSSGGITSATHGQGNAGNIHITTSELSLSDKAGITTSSVGEGDAGGVILEVSKLGLDNSSFIVSETLSQDNGGDGGRMLIGKTIKADFSDQAAISEPADLIQMKNHSVISASSNGQGDAGQIAMGVSQLQMDDNSFIASGSKEGDGGGIAIAETIEVKNLTQATKGTDNNLISLTQPADLIRIQNNSGITTSVAGKGSAGGIALGVSRLETDSGAFIASASAGSSPDANGNAGVILIGKKIEETGNNLFDIPESSDMIQMQGGSHITTSGAGEGHAGAIILRAARLQMDSEAAISSASMGQGKSGNGGWIQIDADTLDMQNSAKITTSSAGEGNAGEILIQTSDFSSDTQASVSSVSRAEGKSGSGGGIYIAKEVKGDSREFRTVQPADMIQLHGGSYITTSSAGEGDAGRILIAGSRFQIDSGAIISSASLSQGKGGAGGGIGIGKEIVITHEENGGDRIAITQPADKIRMESNANINTSGRGDGHAGEIGLGVLQLELDSDAVISSGSKGGGNGGIILIGRGGEESDKSLKLTGDAESVSLGNGAKITTSGEGQGHAGAIFIGTSRLDLDTQASVSSASLSEGNGGDGGLVQISAVEMSLRNNSHITTSSAGEGNAGDINILTSRLETDTQASLSSASLSEGKGGNGGSILIGKKIISSEQKGFIVSEPADSVRMSGYSGISTSSRGEGNAGDIIIASSQLELDTNALISSGSLSKDSSGSGGAIAVAKEISIRDDGTENGKLVISQPADLVRIHSRAGITTSSEGKGDAGKIGVCASNLEMDSAAHISSASTLETYGGQGGIILIGRSIEEIGDDHYDITGAADSIRITDNARISTSAAGIGNAGDISLETDRLYLDNSSVTTDAKSSGGGKIDIKTGKILYLLDSRITTNVRQGIGNGGDIEINATCKMQRARCGAEFVILNHSQIQANADEGDGGAVFIQTDNFLKSFGSIVEASSARGNEGTVEIEAPDLDISGALTVLPVSFFDAARWASTPCEARSGESESRFEVRTHILQPVPFEELP